MINGFWANEGLNDDKGTRQKAIEELEENFSSAIGSVMNKESVQDEEIDKENPFFAAMDTSLPKLEQPSATDMKMAEAVDEQQKEFDRYIDQ